FLRKKFRRDRRPDLTVDPILRFYPRYWVETVSKILRWCSLYLRLRRIYLRIKHDPQRFGYTDLALTPANERDVEVLELFATESARAYVGKEQRLQQSRAGSAALG